MKIKTKQITKKIIQILGILALLYIFLENILYANDLKFIGWVDNVFVIICVLLVGSSIIIFFTREKKDQSEVKDTGFLKNTLEAFGAGIAIIIALVLAITSVGLFIFSYKPEHVVIRDGRKMVAQVDSFVDVNVNLYEYKNFLIRGTKLTGYEWYGSGGFDPFKNSKDPKPYMYTYYDENGNITATNRER